MPCVLIISTVRRAHGCHVFGEVHCVGMHTAPPVLLHLPITWRAWEDSVVNRPAATSCFSYYLPKKWESHSLSLLKADGVSKHIFGFGASKRKGSGCGPPCTGRPCLENLPCLQSWPHWALSSYLPPASVPPEVVSSPANLQGPLTCSCFRRNHDI